MLAVLLAVAVQASNANLLGYWTNESGSVVVLIAPCGTDAVCGTVKWASEKARADAQRGGTMSLIGTSLLTDFVPGARGRWRGTLFVPDLNKRSKAELERLDDDRIRIRGCAVGRLICKSQVWVRDRNYRGGED